MGSESSDSAVKSEMKLSGCFFFFCFAIVSVELQKQEVVAFWLSILCHFHLLVFCLRNPTTEEASDSETRVMGELISRPLKYLVIFLAVTDFSLAARFSSAPATLSQ